jgi:hypothetical protein
VSVRHHAICKVRYEKDNREEDSRQKEAEKQEEVAFAISLDVSSGPSGPFSFLAAQAPSRP